MTRKFRGIEVAQIRLPAPTDFAPHPRLLVRGRGVHAGECFTAWIGKWVDISLEVSWESTGPACWYIATPGYSDVCPIGLFVQI